MDRSAPDARESARHQATIIFTGSIQANANYGVALDFGAKNSIVTNQVLNAGTHNSKDDLFDANSSCGSNKWFANDSTATNNQAGGCIK